MSNFLQNFKTTFSDIENRVNEISATENSYIVSSPSEITTQVERYSEYGLAALGKTVGFPHEFIRTLNVSEPELASSVIEARTRNYFENGGAQFCAREFLGMVCGCVSNRYAYFDDHQVTEIIGKSPLANLEYAHALVSPERLHLRAIDADNMFKIEGDDSPLFFCYFVDNSMVGVASFKVQLGVFRQVCTNGMIMPIKEFVICKQIHRGARDISAEFNKTVAFLDEKRGDIVKLLTDLSTAEAKITTMSEEYRLTYLGKALTMSKKEVNKVLELFTKTYGGKTRWDMVNAITEFARDTNSIDRREHLEKLAIKVS
jgi:hypothetical protein